MLPRPSTVWHVPHLASTSGSVTGMPGSVWPRTVVGMANASRIAAARASV